MGIGNFLFKVKIKVKDAVKGEGGGGEVVYGVWV